MSSEEEGSPPYDVKMENIIIQQNNDLLALQERLEDKDRRIEELQGFLEERNGAIEELQNVCEQSNMQMESLQVLIQNGNVRIAALEKELVTQEAHEKENESLRGNLLSLENALKEKCLEVQELNIKLKSIVERVEDELTGSNQCQFHIRSEHNRELAQLKCDCSCNVKLLTEKNALIEAFLVKQIELLLSRLRHFAGSDQFDFEKSQEEFMEKIHEVKKTVSDITSGALSSSFIKEIEAMSVALPSWLSLEAALTLELRAKSEELKGVREELFSVKQSFNDAHIREEQLKSKCLQSEQIVNNLNEEKLKLQQCLTESNTEYEKATICFNRERLELEKKYNKTILSHETDSAILQKSLESLLHFISGIPDDKCHLNKSICDSINAELQAIVNPNHCSIAHSISECLYGIQNLCSKVKTIKKEYDHCSKALERKNSELARKSEELRKMAIELEFSKSKLTNVECELSYLQNKLKCVVEENHALSENTNELNSQVDLLKLQTKNYEDNISLLKEEVKTIHGGRVFVKEGLESVEKKKRGVSASELMWEPREERSFWSLPGQLMVTSTPVAPQKYSEYEPSDQQGCEDGSPAISPLRYQQPLDMYGTNENQRSVIFSNENNPSGNHNCGDSQVPAGRISNLSSLCHNQNRSSQQIHVSLLKWIERCSKLDHENKQLQLKVCDLEEHNSDLKFTVNGVKERMHDFEKRQGGLEERLSAYMTLKEQCNNLTDEVRSKTILIENLTKQVVALEKERNDLMSSNQKPSIELNSNESVFDHNFIKLFNEKVKELICLKEQFCLLEGERNNLAFKVSLLLEFNNVYEEQLKTQYEKIFSLQDNLEKHFNEKLELIFNNKLLKNEVDLLKLKVGYISQARDWYCQSEKFMDEVQKELIGMLRGVLDDQAHNSNPGEGRNTTELFQLLGLLHDQISNERADFLDKIAQLQELINKAQETNGLDEKWSLDVDKQCRRVIEEIKHHREHYSRIEESLKVLQDKKHLAVFDGDVITAKKAKLDFELVSAEMRLKNDLLKECESQNERLQEELKELKTKLSQLEMKYEADLQKAKWDNQLAHLNNIKAQLDKKLLSLGHNDDVVRGDGVMWESAVDLDVKERQLAVSTDITRKQMDTVETCYEKALQDLKQAFNAEISQLQNQHLQQVEALKQTITEQAVLIGAHQIQLGKASESTDENIFLINTEARRQLDFVLTTVGLVHKEELALVRLELGRNREHPPPLLIEEDNVQDDDTGATSLLTQLQSILLRDFIQKLKKVVKHWHCSYSSRVSEIERQIQDSLSGTSVTAVTFSAESADRSINEYNSLLSSALGFFKKLDEEYSTTLQQLQQFTKHYKEITLNCFDELKTSYLGDSELHKMKEHLNALLIEKEDLESRHKSAVELLKIDRRAVEIKLTSFVNEVKRCSKDGSEPVPDDTLRLQLEEEHRKELDHLRTYYVQMCSNLEKQYTEDVISLHSKLASITSSSPDHSNSELIFASDISQNSRRDEIISKKDLEMVQFTDEQIQYIGELKTKWSEDIRELKKNLEKKYSAKMEEFRGVLSSYLYKGELEMCARCLKDEVMRECEAEIASINEKLSQHVESYQKKVAVISPSHSGNPQPTHQFSEACCPTEMSLPISFTDNNEAFGTYIKHIFNIQEANSLIILKLFPYLDNTLSSIHNKVKEKEIKLTLLQNKLNSFRYFVLKNCNNSINDMLKNGRFSSEELLNIIKTAKTKLAEYEVHCVTADDSSMDLEKYPGDTNVCYESDMGFKEEYNKLIKERDSLKEMTLTLKNAVSQLVMYLNTCEDELNRTVVDELIKICDETPRKGSDSPVTRRVHFAPEASYLDDSKDLSASLRLQLDSCLSKLKIEAASLLGLTALHPPPANLSKQIDNLRKENEELLEEISLLKLHIDKCNQDPDAGTEEFFSDSSSQFTSFVLLDRMQFLLSKSETHAPETTKLLEDLANYGDKLITELQKEKIDLQQQIGAADKQLKATRKFLEEQAQERESERDEYSREVKSLQEQLKESNRHSSSHQLFSSQLQQLELQLIETKGQLEEAEKVKEATENELKEAIEKIWVLRDIISDLEVQLNRKSEKEELLEKKLDELEAELDHTSDTHIAMAQELESLRGQSMEDSYLEQIKQLQENIKVQFDSSVVRHIKLQLQEMQSAVDHRTKEIENLYLTYSNPSSSSPSEEISLREQLEVCRNKSPEDSPSPVALPVQELARLQDKLARHATAEQVLFKRYRDAQLTSTKLALQLEEMQAERDVIQNQMKRQMVQLAESNNKIDDLRHKVEMAQTTANKDLVLEMQELKEKYSAAEEAFSSLQNELTEQKSQLACAEEIIRKQRNELQTIADSNHEIIDSLRLQLAAVTAEKNKLEDLSHKQKQDFNFDVINALLVDKNEDIEQLQQTVSLLQSQEASDKQISFNSKGHRVSFASDIQDTSVKSPDVSRLRDALHHIDSHIMSHSTEEELEKCPEESVSLLSMKSVSDTSDPSPQREQLIDHLRHELEEKSHQLLLMQNEMDCLKSVQEDLKNTKIELEAVLSSVSNDKQYYETHLQSLSEEIKKKDTDIKSFKQTILEKDAEILKKTADVRVLEDISVKLQEKLEQATKIVKEQNFTDLDVIIKDKERELTELKEELLACKNDLGDEKELSEILKSSLNVLTREKTQLEEQMTLMQMESGNVANALLIAEKKLDSYVNNVKLLRNALISKSDAELSDCRLLSISNQKCVGDDEYSELKEEIAKLLALNKELNSERSVLLDEIKELKHVVFSEDYKTKGATITQLQEDLVKLRTAVLAIKEEKVALFSNLSSEIDYLKREIASLNGSKEALRQRLNKEVSEKDVLLQKYLTLQEGSDRNKSSDIKQNSHCNKRALSFCDVNILDIPPDNSITGLDILAEKMRNEINLSKCLDNALLGTINFNRQETASERFHREEEFTSSEAIKRALLEEVKRCEEIKNELSEKFDRCETLEAENNQLRIESDRLQRLITNQNVRINEMGSQIEFQKEKNMQLELTVLREQSNLKQISLLLEDERAKGRHIQQEDISLIETMRQRLQNSMENEIKLKKRVLEERAKSDKLLAQLNSLRALENFRSECSDIGNKNVNKEIENERSKYSALWIEYEKEKKSCEDLRTVLTRERAAISMLNEKLRKSERMQQETEKEVYSLKKSIEEEVLRRQQAESKIVQLKQSSETRTKVTEYNKQKELDSAHLIRRELEKEVSTLMRKLTDLKIKLNNKNEECISLRNNCTDLRKTATDLMVEHGNLVQTVKSLQQERGSLTHIINSLRQERLNLMDIVKTRREEPIPQVRICQLPQVEELVRDLMVAERHRKALVFQKQYLLVSLRGYQLSQLRLLPRNIRDRQQPSLKCVALTVLACLKLIKLPTRRLLQYNKKKESIIDKVRQVFTEAGTLARSSTPQYVSSLALPHSPPSRET